MAATADAADGGASESESLAGRREPARMRERPDGRTNAALKIMRALFQLFDEDGRLATLLSSHMYEHFLPNAVKAVAPIAGPMTVALLCDLLDQAVRISRRVT